MKILTDSAPARGLVRRPIVPEFGHDHSNNYHAEQHHQRADYQHRLSTDFVDDQLLAISGIRDWNGFGVLFAYHARHCADEEDNASHSSRQESNSTTRKSKAGENIRRVVNNCTSR